MPICQSLVRRPKKDDSWSKRSWRALVNLGQVLKGPVQRWCHSHHCHLSLSKYMLPTISWVSLSKMLFRLKYCSICAIHAAGWEPSNLCISNLGGHGRDYWWGPQTWREWLDSPSLCPLPIYASSWASSLPFGIMLVSLSSWSWRDCKVCSSLSILSLAIAWALVSTMHRPDVLEIWDRPKKISLRIEWYHCAQLVVLILMG